MVTATWRQRALQAPHTPPNDKSKKAPISQGLFVLLRGEDLNLRPSGYEPDELPDCSTPRHVSHSKVAKASGKLLPTAQESRRSYMSDEESSAAADFTGFYSPSNHAGTSGEGLPVEMTHN